MFGQARQFADWKSYDNSEIGLRLLELMSFEWRFDDFFAEKIIFMLGIFEFSKVHEDKFQFFLKILTKEDPNLLVCGQNYLMS